MNLRPGNRPSSARSVNGAEGDTSPGHADAVVELLAARAHVDVTVPRTSIKARMRLVSRSEVSTIRIETREYLAGVGIPVDATGALSLGAIEEWNAELAVRLLAIAMREPANEARALASIEDWRECDDDQIGNLYQQYKDLEQRLDPAASETLTEADLRAIENASKKKAVDQLMLFGSRKLALYVTTSANPPSTSPTPSSSSS